jgi:glycosyltransferase involved in cell wall biosynthesis
MSSAVPVSAVFWSKKVQILLVVPSQDPATGNWVTAHRFRDGLESRGHKVSFVEVALDSADFGSLRKAARQADAALLLHAYRSGRPWLEAGLAETLPFGVLMTGTDINFGMDDSAQAAVIDQVLQRAAAIFIQSRQAVGALEKRAPRLIGRLRYLAPGVSLGHSTYDLRQKQGVGADEVVFLCPAGIRPVKGVLGLLGLFDRVASCRRGFRVLFCGPVLARGYARRFEAALAHRPWAGYLGVIPPEAMAAAMRGADVVLNNSRAEGLSNALMEAAALGVPILARDIEGNADVVVPGCNGLLYGDVKSFCHHSLELIDSPELRRRLSRPSSVPLTERSAEIDGLEAFFRSL